MLDYANTPDLKAQLFYRFLQWSFFPSLFVVMPYLAYKVGGMEHVAWAIAIPLCYGWQSAFLVNSAAHVWGRRPYDTGECWCVRLALLLYHNALFGVECSTDMRSIHELTQVRCTCMCHVTAFAR